MHFHRFPSEIVGIAISAFDIQTIEDVLLFFWFQELGLIRKVDQEERSYRCQSNSRDAFQDEDLIRSATLRGDQTHLQPRIPWIPSIFEMAYARTTIRHLITSRDILPAKALAIRPTLYIHAIREWVSYRRYQELMRYMTAGDTPPSNIPSQNLKAARPCLKSTSEKK
jgi:hypothetical protein